MPISQAFMKAVGVLARNLKEPQWYVGEASRAANTIYVVGPAGHQIKASLNAHLFDKERDKNGNVIADKHIANAYVCENGHEYLDTGGKIYRHDRSTDTWVPA